MTKAEGNTPARFVRVLGTLRERYVEFLFGIGDEDISVQLVLPFAAFHEFCTAQRCEILTPREQWPGPLRGSPGEGHLTHHQANGRGRH